MKKHNTVKVVLITILVFLLLSWIIPAAYYSGQYVDQGRVQMGLYELFNYPLTSLSYFGYIALFIIFIGGFYGVLYKIPAYRNFLDKVVLVFKGKEKLFVSLVIVLLALSVSICGLQLALIFFIPFLVSVILLMGYDKVVSAMTIVGSIVVGLIGSTYAYTNSSMLLSVLSLDWDFQVGVRFLILLVGVALLIFNTLMYIKNHMNNSKITVASTKKNADVEDVKVEEKQAPAKKKSSPKKTSAKKTTKSTSKSTNKTAKTKKASTTKSRKSDNKAALREEDIIVVKESVVMNSEDDSYLIPTRIESSHKIWPFLCGFILMFILMVLAFITWGEGGFNISLFNDVTKSVAEFELFGFPIFAKIYGTLNAFGTWTVIDLLLPMALLLVILVLIYKVKFDDILDGFAEGAKKALAPAFISILVYAILVLATYHPFQLTIFKAVLGLGKGFNIVTTAIVALLASIFNGDAAYVYQSALPYYISVVTNADHYALVGIIFQTMYGFAMLFAPTSLILMGTLSYLKVSYKDWLKSIWKLLLELFVILLIIFIILALI